MLWILHSRHVRRLLCTSAFLLPLWLSAQPLPREVLVALARAGVPPHAMSVMVQALPAFSNSTGNTSSTSSTAQAQPAPALPPAPAPALKHRADASVNPASVMKLITTYAALDQLGADFTWKNRVYIDGSLDNGILQGNLILRGSGDPKLVLERIDDLFKQVLAKGVREVRGDILLDRRVFDVPDKNPADFDDEPLRPTTPPPMAYCSISNHSSSPSPPMPQVNAPCCALTPP